MPQNPTPLTERSSVVDDAVPLRRLGPPLCLLHLGWALPSAAGGTLLQALVAEQRGSGKVGALTLVTAVGAVVAVISTVVAGAWSDRTRSTLGKRNPWIIGGALIGAAGLTLTGAASWLPLQIVSFAAFQGGLNAMLAAAGALLPDRVKPESLGKAASFAGVGYLTGTALGGFAASAAISSPRLGLMVVPWTMAVAAAVLVAMVPERSTRFDSFPPAGTPREVVRSLLPPRDRDFLLAFAGRICVVLGLSVFVFYQLYVFTDFLDVDVAEAASRIAVGTTLLAVSALVAAVAGGWLSDRWRRRKPLVITASLLVALGAVPVYLSPGITPLMSFYVIAGLGYGLYLSVDAALMVEVLPTTGAEAKELGMLSIANSAPSVIAPPIAAALVGLFGFHALFLFTVVSAAIGGLCIAAIRRAR